MTGSTLLLQFNGHRRERDLIGKMLLSYGELEFVMLDMLGAVLENRTHAVRVIYQLRSEVNRLTVFEAVAAPAFDKVGLGGQLKEGMDALSHCKNIRNQYAHCTWCPSSTSFVGFANLEVVAKTKGANPQMVVHPLSEELVKKQWAYFEYADHMLLWLNQQFRLKTGKPTEGAIVSKPTRQDPPKLHSHGEARTRLSLTVGKWHLQ